MQHEPGIFEERDPEAEAASLARAHADLAAGRYAGHDVVTRWLQTWGKPGRLPFREWLKSLDG